MRLAALSLVLVAMTAAPRVALAADTCDEAYTQAQILRRSGKLRSAKQALVFCSQESCVSAIQTDCVKWTEEVDRSLSTVVFDVRLPDGSEVTDVQVYAGDELVAPSLDGRHVSLDPGETVIRFVRGSQSVEKRALIREGEKLRTIHVELPAEGAPSSPPPQAPPPPELSSPGAGSGKPIPTMSWVLGGVGVAGLATFGALAGIGYANESTLRDGCFKTDSCAPSDVQSVRTEYLAGDIALGVGVVSLAVAVGYWLFSAPQQAATARARRAPTRAPCAARSNGVFSPCLGP